MAQQNSLFQRLWKNPRRLSYIIIIFVGIAVIAGSYTFANKPNSSKQNSQQLGTLDKAIETDQNKLNANPKNAKLLVGLCQDYLQKVRETADPSYYSKCDDLLKKAVTSDKDSPSVIATQASLAYGRHHFAEGLPLAQRASSLDLNHAAYYGLVGDGQIERGQYTEAAASFQSMINKRPDLSAYNRVAYIREIYGDITGAETALKSAITSGSGYQENVAYSQVELGKLYARTDLDVAEKIFKEALYTYKNFPPALEGLGKVAFGRKDYAKAISYFDQAFTFLPLAQYSNDLADTYAVQGNQTKAKQQYYLSDLAFEKSSSGGVNNSFEKSAYLTNHERDLKSANALAVEALADRPNAFSYDALAWNLYKLDNFTEAQGNITKALEAGSHAPIIQYHAGMIAAKLGQKDQAKAYLNQAFSLDKFFLESHFSLLDRQLGEKTLATL